MEKWLLEMYNKIFWHEYKSEIISLKKKNKNKLTKYTKYTLFP